MSRDDLTVVGADLAVRRATADAVCLLRRHQLEPVVLKGPLLADWIRTPGRLSEDVDLLVEPSSSAEVHRALRAEGFRQVLPAHSGPEHATSWTRGDEAIALDVHISLPGATATPETQWLVVGQHRTPSEVDGHAVFVPDSVLRLVLLALHAAHHGAQEHGPLDDLARGLALAGDSDWQDAAALADELGAAPAFAAGLRLVPAGGALADRLGLHAPCDTAVALRASKATHTAFGFERLSSAVGFRARAHVVVDEILPARSYMRDWSPLARHGRVGLVLAYLYRPLWLAWWAPRGYLAWRRAKRVAAASQRDAPD